MNKPKLWTKSFISISLSNFFLFLTFYVLLVTLPIYAIQEFHSNASEAGLMTTVFLFLRLSPVRLLVNGLKKLVIKRFCLPH